MHESHEASPLGPSASCPWVRGRSGRRQPRPRWAHSKQPWNSSRPQDTMSSLGTGLRTFGPALGSVYSPRSDRKLPWVQVCPSAIVWRRATRFKMCPRRSHCSRFLVVAAAEISCSAACFPARRVFFLFLRAAPVRTRLGDRQGGKAYSAPGLTTLCASGRRCHKGACQARWGFRTAEAISSWKPSQSAVW